MVQIHLRVEKPVGRYHLAADPAKPRLMLLFRWPQIALMNHLNALLAGSQSQSHLALRLCELRCVPRRQPTLWRNQTLRTPGSASNPWVQFHSRLRAWALSPRDGRGEAASRERMRGFPLHPQGNLRIRNL